MKYKTEEGFNHFKKHEIYRVLGIDNEYVGEWHTSKIECKKEYDLLQKAQNLNNLLHDYIMDEKFAERPCNDTDWSDYMTQSNKALLKSGNWQLCEKYEELSQHEMRNLMKQELENMITLYENIKKAS